MLLCVMFDQNKPAIFPAHIYAHNEIRQPAGGGRGQGVRVTCDWTVCFLVNQYASPGDRLRPEGEARGTVRSYAMSLVN